MIAVVGVDESPAAQMTPALDQSAKQSVPQPISLRRRVINAGAWSLAGYCASQTIRFGTNLIMTRLLVPEMFGVVSIAMVIMIGLAMFSDLGLGQSIVQNRRGDDPDFLNTAWSLQIVRGLLIWSLALLAALILHLAVDLFPSHSVYADPSLPILIAVLSFVAVIDGFTATRAFQASRNLALGRITSISIVAQVAGLAVMIPWAWYMPSVWTLVGGSIMSSGVTVSFGHLLLPGIRNRWHWDRTAAATIIHFGKWILFASILGFFAANLDRLILGGVLDAATMGIFTIAYLIYSAVDQLISRVVSNVAFPALSEVARGEGNLRVTYYKLHAFVAGLAYFCSGLLLTSGGAMVSWVYDPRYASAGWMVQILAVGLLTTPVHLAVQVYLARGQPQILPAILILRIVALMVAVPAGFATFGLSGALWGIVAAQFTAVPFLLIKNSKTGLLLLTRELLVLPLLAVGALTGVLLATTVS